MQTIHKKVVFFIFLCGQLQRAFNVDMQGACKHKNNCHECITDPGLCAWCSADNLKLEDRCHLTNSEQAKACPEEHSHNPHSTKDVDRNDDFTSVKDHVIQIKPQKINMKLRVGEQMEFQLHYKAVENYPVDLYFLLDASNSMEPTRNDLFNKSTDIYNAMYNLTSNVYLGYGTFIDKNVFPFIRNYEQGCYSFKHYLNLTPSLNNFTTALNETNFQGNFDPPESGLDGLGQVMACNKKIGFREQSRKVIIFITDNYSHYAGDGHVAGLINPYDGGCYLDINGSYTKEKEMDYPSVGIISKLAADDQFTIFFIVTNYYDTYENLTKAISGAMAAQYGDDSVVEQLKHFYMNISDNIQLDLNSPAEEKDHFEITFDPDCSKKNNCAVVIGQEIHIRGFIKLKEYYGKNHTEIPIVQKGLKEELKLEIEIISKCDCELEGNYTVGSKHCHAGGDLQCGICKCYEHKSGPTCACDDNNTTISADTTPCVKDGIECSKSGICICGKCSCRPGLGGKYCEVRTDTCPRDEDTSSLCYGHGECWNGTCECSPLWEGVKCDCSKSTDLCMTNGAVCHNRGKCKCNRCICNPVPKWDVRESQEGFCEQRCDNCHTRQCTELTDCLVCYNSNNNTEDCTDVCGERLSFVTNMTDNFRSNWNNCPNARVSFGCYANFSYAYNDEAHEILLYWTSERNCKEGYYKYGAMALVTAIVVGLAIMWALKLLTDAHDRAEYNRFLSTPEDDEGEVENPVYKQPSNTFRNPNFKRSFNFR